MSPKLKIFLFAALPFAILFPAAFIVGSLLHLRGGEAYLVRSVFSLLGLGAAGAILWYFLPRASAASAAKGPSEQDQLDDTISEARRRLATSAVAGKGSIGELPLVLLLGPTGTTKTTSVLHSGLDPELLAGDVYRGDTVVSTEAANVWYADQTVFVEAGGKITDDPSLWSRLLRLIQPKRLAAAVSGGRQAPRLAMVFFSCEELLKAGASQSVPAAARTLRQRLVDASQDLGIALPVYVVFSKSDRIPFFEDYVRNLSNEEARQVLGATLRLPQRGGNGTYVQREHGRLEEAFQGISHSLALKRLKYLPRETVPEHSAGAYEFPREFQKIAPLAIEFLVDLCRPSQLQVSPFLRGFYFTGVRPVVVSDAGPVAPSASVPGSGALRVDATMVFDPGAHQPAPQLVAPGSPSSRRVPQWVFLERIFGGIVLRDRVAMGTAGGGMRVNRLRRLFLTVAGALALLLVVGFTTSFFANRGLQGRVRSAMEAVRAVGPPQGALATTAHLVLLDSLREQVESLGEYEREGAPWRLRWWLYSGSRFFPDARQAYFAAFDRLLFDRAHSALLGSLTGVPDAPDPSSDYGATYDLLKTYLITTVHPERSTVEFLVPSLMDLWQQGQALDEEYVALGRRQVDFYARELAYGNPFPEEADQALVTRVRRFLWAFGAADPFYRSLVSDAGRGIRPVRFEELVPGSGRVIATVEDVPGAFTSTGWEEVQSRLDSPEDLLQTEVWVLGQEAPTPDPANLAVQLRAMYEAEYATRWRAFLAGASVVPFLDAADGAVKLGALSGSESPLLRLLYLTARNTSVGSPPLDAAFQPVHVVTPFDSTETPLNETNQPYRMALGMLGSSLEEAAGATGEDLGGARQQVRMAMRQALSASQQVTTGFAGTPESGPVARDVIRLLEGPVDEAGRAIEGTFLERFAEQVRPLCQEVGSLLAFYPFSGNLDGAAASLEDMASLFRPGSSALWAVYSDQLEPLLDRRGSSFVPKRDAPYTLTPAFIEAFNRAAQFSEAIYRSPDADPRVSFTFRPVLSESVESVTLVFAGQTYRFTRTSNVTATLDWDGRRAGEVRLLARMDGVERTVSGPFNDPWGMFRLFQQASGWDVTGPRHTVRWSVVRDNRELELVADVELLGLPPIFRRDYFAGMRCPGRLVQ